MEGYTIHSKVKHFIHGKSTLNVSEFSFGDVEWYKFDPKEEDGVPFSQSEVKEFLAYLSSHNHFYDNKIQHFEEVDILDIIDGSSAFRKHIFLQDHPDFKSTYYFDFAVIGFLEIK